MTAEGWFWLLAFVVIAVEQNVAGTRVANSNKSDVRLQTNGACTLTKVSDESLFFEIVTPSTCVAVTEVKKPSLLNFADKSRVAETANLKQTHALRHEQRLLRRGQSPPATSKISPQKSNTKPEVKRQHETDGTPFEINWTICFLFVIHIYVVITLLYTVASLWFTPVDNLHVDYPDSNSVRKSPLPPGPACPNNVFNNRAYVLDRGFEVSSGHQHVSAAKKAESLNTADEDKHSKDADDFVFVERYPPPDMNHLPSHQDLYAKCCMNIPVKSFYDMMNKAPRQNTDAK